MCRHLYRRISHDNTSSSHRYRHPYRLGEVLGAILGWVSLPLQPRCRVLGRLSGDSSTSYCLIRWTCCTRCKWISVSFDRQGFTNTEFDRGVRGSWCFAIVKFLYLRTVSDIRNGTICSHMRHHASIMRLIARSEDALCDRGWSSCICSRHAPRAAALNHL